MTEFHFTIPSILFLYSIHKLGLFEDNTCARCGKAYFTLATWNQNNKNNE